MQNSHSQQDSFFLWRKVILIIVFFSLAPITLIVTIVSLFSITNLNSAPDSKASSNLIQNPKSGVFVYASLPEEFPVVSGEVIAGDSRIEIIKQFLEHYNSPMTPYANVIVEKADQYGLDFRLTTAIAMKESGLGKKMPPNCNNAWGLGIHSKGTWCFDSWEEGIGTVSRILKENYIDEGYVTVEEIMNKYAHASSTTWAEGVSFYMNKME